MHNIPGKEAGQLTYGNLNKRVIAFFVDLIVISVIPIIAVVMPLYFIGAVEPTAKYVSVGEIALLLSIVLIWIYEAAMHSSSYQATLGKMIFGLRVTDLAGNRISFARATGRFLVKFLPIYFIGCFLANFTKNRKALHDMIAGTLVLEN